jgi:hypothetical protein
MSVGGLFLVLSFLLWFLVGIGVHTIPGAEAFAHACLALGMLLSGVPFGPFWRAP